VGCASEDDEEAWIACHAEAVELSDQAAARWLKNDRPGEYERACKAVFEARDTP
jgi:hypothetical protein